MKKQRLFRLFLSICALFLSILSGAALALELKVVTEEWRPYNYKENNEIKGTSTGIVKKVLARADIDYTITVYPWARAYHMARKKQNCMIYTIIRIAPRETLFKWIRPLGKGGRTNLYRLRSKPAITIDTADQAKNYSIITNRDSMSHIWLEHKGFTNLYLTTSYARTIQLFFRGGADLTILDTSVLKEGFANLGHDQKEIVMVFPMFRTPPYMALSLSTSDEVVQRLQLAYDELMAEGEINLVN